MPSLKTIRKRITSVKSTKKITGAMKMVAGARLNRAQQRITALRPYAVKTQEVLGHVASTLRADAKAEAEREGPGHEEDLLHPLLTPRTENKVLFLVLTSDRGLCGAFNTNIMKAVAREWSERREKGLEVSFATIGRKGREYLTRRDANIAQNFLRIYEGVDLEKARTVSSWLVDQYEKNEFDAVYIVYNEFKSAITQKLTFERLLPVPTDAQAEGDAQPADFLFEPNGKAVLERLVPMYVEISVYRALLESQASEFGARMTAMDAATRNASDMIGRLTLVYNRARQAAITKELMEIIGGAEALKD
ncbi:MAG: ATP synthase F1 subunit gamma [Myxococcales bacterium]|nr:ATP synthase F1 subunit gamma [Myxococcales bacterium]